MLQVDALVFDAYGTLFNVHSVVAKCEQFFPGKGHALSQLWRTKQLEYTWLRSLMGRYVDFNVVTADALKYACAALGLDGSGETLTQLMRAYSTLETFDDAQPVLKALREKYPAVKLAILSNGAPAMLDAVVRHNRMESMLDAVLSVDAVSVFKPDPRVYQLAVDRLHVTAQRIGFVSSNGWDAAGAKAFGFTVFWVNRANAPVEELGFKPDFVVDSLRDIPDLMAG